MKIYLHIYFFISIIILTSVGAEAGTIKMATSLKTAIAGEQINVKVKIKNKGDEAAYNIKAAIEIRGIEKVRHLKDKLRGDETCEAAFSFPLNGKKGWYPIIVDTTYSDYNQNPYQIITVTKYALKGRPSEISAHYIKPGETAATAHICLKNNETKDLAVFIKDNSQTAIQKIPHLRKEGTKGKEKLVTLRLIYPENVDIEPGHFQITLGWNEKQIIPFRIKNRSFNPGSSIPVYAIAEYDEKGTHYLAITSILLSIEKGESLFARWNKALITAGALLTLICMATNMRRFRKPGVNPDTEIQNRRSAVFVEDSKLSFPTSLLTLRSSCFSSATSNLNIFSPVPLRQAETRDLTTIRRNISEMSSCRRERSQAG